MNTDRDRLERTLAVSGAWLFVAAAITGVMLSWAMVKKIPMSHAGAHGAHMNALIGSLWLLGLGWSLRFSNLAIEKLTLMVRLAVVAAWANVIITAIKAFLHVEGVDFGQIPSEGGSPAASNGIFVLLVLFVVLPTFGSSILWAWGMRGAPAAGANP